MISCPVAGNGDLIRLTDHNDVRVRFPAGFEFLPKPVRTRSFHPKADRAIPASSVKENGFVKRV